MPTDQYRRRSNHRTAVASIIARMGLDVFAARYRINRRSAERLATGWHYVPKGLRDELVQTLTGLPDHKADVFQLLDNEIFEHDECQRLGHVWSRWWSIPADNGPILPVAITNEPVPADLALEVITTRGCHICGLGQIQ